MKKFPSFCARVGEDVLKKFENGSMNMEMLVSERLSVVLNNYETKKEPVLCMDIEPDFVNRGDLVEYTTGGNRIFLLIVNVDPMFGMVRAYWYGPKGIFFN